MKQGNRRAAQPLWLRTTHTCTIFCDTIANGRCDPLAIVDGFNSNTGNIVGIAYNGARMTLHLIVSTVQALAIVLDLV